VKYRIFFIILLAVIPAVLFAGTLFEDEKKTSDPYIGDRGGFNSLFVNPAGAAGQSGFELAVTAGARTKMNDVKLIMGVTEMAVGLSGDPADMEAAIGDAAQTLSDLLDNDVITEDLLDAVFEGTGLDPDAFTDWDDPAAIQAVVDGGGVDPAVVESNLDQVMNNPGSPQYNDFYAGLPQEVRAEALMGFKTGFLVKGWGLGVYDQATTVAFMDPATQQYGLETIYNELGVIAGGGFTVMDGKLAFGLSGNYGILMKNTSPVAVDSFDTLINGSINYGYSWGLDLGAIWRPTPSLGVGVVFNDVVGYTEADTPRTAAGFEGLIQDQAFLMNSLDYQFTMDIDAGITWQPDWRFVTPKISADLYNVIGYARDVADEGDDFEAAMYRTLEHIRVGANFTFFDFLKVGGQYYDHYLSVGAGLDLLFLELYGEFKIQDQAVFADNLGDVPIGGDITVRIHF